MSEGQAQGPAGEAAVRIPAAKRQFLLGRWILRGVALLYAAYFFFAPAYRNTFLVWMECAGFFAAFLALFFLTAMVRGRRQAAAFVLYFLLAFAYYLYNPGAYGVFVYPFAMLCLFLTRLRTLFGVLAAMMAVVAVEARSCGRPWIAVEEILFASVILGLSNFAFAQQERTNRLLERANFEIERLTQEAERERIARDLHDLLGHTLTVIAVKLDLARRLLGRDADRARQEMADAEQTARQALAEVREAVQGYRGDGLDAEMSRARRSLLAADVQLTTALEGAPLSPGQANVLCLALREAVTNIVRHAHATECRVALVEEDGTIRFTIEDNGRGGASREGNGLRGMRERVQSMNGAVKVTDAEQGGTSLTITLPVEKAAPTRSAAERAREAEAL